MEELIIWGIAGFLAVLVISWLFGLLFSGGGGHCGAEGPGQNYGCPNSGACNSCDARK